MVVLFGFYPTPTQEAGSLPSQTPQLHRYRRRPRFLRHTAPASQRISRCNLRGRDSCFFDRVLASDVFPSKISCQVQATLRVWKSLRHCTRRNPSSLLRLRQRGSFRVRFGLVASSFLRHITKNPVALQVHLALAVRSQGQGPVLRLQVPVR